MFRIFLQMLALDTWMMYYSALILLVSSIDYIFAQHCGGNYTTNDGIITSTNYPNVYDVSSVCNYTISLPDISSITLNFETFELDRSPDDHVLIDCGSNNSQEQIVYYWNDAIQPISIPWCNSVLISLFSDFDRYNYTTRGFKVHYQVSTKDCGNTVFNASSGTISSPNYPQNYNNDENCTYSIWARESSSFTLTFEAFQLESDCQRDWVQIRCENSGQTFPKYCGSTSPRPVHISNCNKVLIWFHTDNSSVFSGFVLQYSVTSHGCGKSNYAGLSGIITSPNYPNPYTKMDPACDYYVYPVSSVVLSFQSFDLGPFIDTKNGDNVKIECDGNSSGDSFFLQGYTLPPMISYSRCSRVRISFFANNAICGPGFNIKYQVNPSVAYSNITNAQQNFTVHVGSRKQLNCTSTTTEDYPSWTLSKDGTDENTAVIASFCVVNSNYNDTYEVESDGPGVCNLVIRNATLAETGVYTCIDVGLASLSLVVTVVPIISNTSNNQDYSDVIIIVLAVLLAICVLGYIGIVIHFTVRQNRETSEEEEGHGNADDVIEPANCPVETEATRPDYNGIPIFLLLTRPEPETTNTATSI